MAPSIEIMGGGDEASTAGGITASFTVAENSMDAVEGAAGAVLGLITLSDPDAGDTHTVEVDNDHFQVIDHAGAKWLTLKSGVSLDFEENETVTLTVTVTDSGDPAESASAEVTITVTDVNEAPSIDVRDGEEVPGHAGVVSSLTIAENAMRADAPPLALIEVMDPDAADQDHLKGDAGIAATSVSDDRFAVILDPEMGLWLHLAEGASLDYEDGDTVMVTVTFTDSAGNTASQDVTVMVTDVNEGPEVTGEVDPVTTLAGKAIKADPIDLLMLFSDPDEGDAPVRYEVSDAPEWLKFSVEYGKDDDGNDYAHGILTGTPPTTTADSDAATKVTLTATDGGGESASAHFYVIVDDGNDVITDVDFIVDGNVAVEAEVDENNDDGVVFGEIRIQDDDHPMHPNGMHQILILEGKDSSTNPRNVDDRFEVREQDGKQWLALKEGMSLDHEKEEGSVDVVIRVVDMGGATTPNGRAFLSGTNIEFETVTIYVNDKNDAPKAQPIGNWWVTAEGGRRAEEVDAGDWLEFNLTKDDPGSTTDKPAFIDLDEGDTLTYTLTGSSPSWLEIKDNVIQNTKGGVPVRGVHKITVTATDEAGEPDSAHFYLAVALSGDGTDDTAEDDNDEPRFGNPQEYDYDENSGMRKVATFTVTDEDNDLMHHPFALDSVRITSVVNADNDNGDPNNRGGGGSNPAYNADTGYAAAFRLSKPVKSADGDTWTYDLYVQDTNPLPGPMNDSTTVLNHEDVDRIEVTITAMDGVADPVTEVIDIRIDDANDLPMALDIVAGTNTSGSTYGVEQREAQEEVLYIKLEDLWMDAEDDRDDLMFDASVSGSWVKILHSPKEWGDIEGVTWGDPPGDQTGVVIGAAGVPDPNEQVVIIELDRVKNNGPNDGGSFTLYATDRDGGTNDKKYTIPFTDENLPPDSAVTLFNDDKDPDLVGSTVPALVIYQWWHGTDKNGEGGTLVHQGTSNTYRLTQRDVNNHITVKVKHYEVGADENARQLVGFNVEGTDENEDTTTRIVSNTPDKGEGHITILADNNVLSVADPNLSVTDGDYVDPDGNPPNRSGLVGDDDVTITWEESDNGRGGWKAVDGAGPDDGDGDHPTLTLDDGKGKFYRAVATYNANNDDDGDPDTSEEMESVYSDPIQVADVSNSATDAPSISGNAFPGGTLSVEARNTSVQWQQQVAGAWVDIPGATGSLTLTEYHAGDIIRALVSYHSTEDNNPGVTAVVAVPAVSGGGAIPGATTAEATPVAVGKHDIELSVTGTGHPPPGVSGNNAGHNLSHTETIDLASLFQDPDSAQLIFTVNSTGEGLGTATPTGGTYVYDDGNAVGGVLVFEVQGHSGKLTFNSDVYRGHDNDGTDGQGNVLKLNIVASDLDGNSSTTNTDTGDQSAAVNLRINVAPIGINFFTDEERQDPIADNALTRPEVTGAPRVGTFIASLDVVDENDPEDDSGFSLHKVTVSDDRFEIRFDDPDGDGKADDKRGDTWELWLKPGEHLDYENRADREITLTFKATDEDGAGLSTPSGRSAPTLTITLNDLGDDQGEVDPQKNQPSDHQDVPGLEDDEGTGDVDDTTDTKGTDGGTLDDDYDGGAPPPPGMSLGGLVEDFVGNMDGFEQDILEDFMLIIDDGIEIA